MVTGATGGSSNRPDTFFAPAGRDALEELQRKRDTVNQNATLRAMLDAMPSWVFVLNEQRQVVTANSSLLKLVRRTEEELIGSRPGEVIGCVHAAHGPDGCGTGKPCIDCGAVRTFLQSQNTGKTVTGDCRLRLDNSSPDCALELRVTATPVEIAGEQLTLVALEDIGDRSRLAVLTRVFFHDVMNTIVGLKTHFQVIAHKAAKGSVDPEEIGGLEKYLDELGDEIRSQRELMLAEAGDLKVSTSILSTSEFLSSLLNLFSPEEESAEVVLGEVWEGELTTDRSLLTRVLVNMLRNGVEATRPDQKVTLSCHDCGEAVRMSVHNEEVMAEDVQRQVFLRSFSTKAATGRGIGTHSMKLIGEHYLLGRVDFESADGQGTTFWIELPKEYAAR